MGSAIPMGFKVYGFVPILKSAKETNLFILGRTSCHLVMYKT